MHGCQRGSMLSGGVRETAGSTECLPECCAQCPVHVSRHSRLALARTTDTHLSLRELLLRHTADAASIDPICKQLPPALSLHKQMRGTRCGKWPSPCFSLGREFPEVLLLILGAAVLQLPATYNAPCTTSWSQKAF